MSLTTVSRAVCAALAAMTLGACAVGPDFHKPEAPKNAGYTVAALPATTSSADTVAGEAQKLLQGKDPAFRWWESFGSPALDKIVEESFRANPSIPAAQAALVQAQEFVKAQNGYFYPTVGASYGFERQQYPGNTASANAPGQQGNGQYFSPQPYPGLVTPMWTNYHTAQLNVGYVPDVFGANMRKVESLEAQAEVQRFELEATYQMLAANVVSAAIQEASTREQIKATHLIIDFNQKQLNILLDKFHDGYAMRLDVALQEAQLAQAQALLPPLEKQLEQTRDLLRALLGKMPNEELPQTFDFSGLKLPQDIPVSLPSKLIEQRPDVRAAEEQVRSANAQVGVALAAMLPQFSLDATYGGTASTFPWLFRNGGPFWSLIGSVTQTVFDGGTLLHTRRAADQALIQAAAQYQGTVITAYQNVADSLHALLSDADALGADLRAERAAKVAAEVAREQMADGFTDYLTELASEIAYQQALLSLVQAQATRFGDTVALYQSLGGGWWNRDEGADKPAKLAQSDAK